MRYLEVKCPACQETRKTFIRPDRVKDGVLCVPCSRFVRRGKKLNVTTHGMSDTRVFRIWNKMTRRCRSQKDARYKDYGGRGITVCERWLKFDNFYADMGEPPTAQHSIDRIDVNGSYEPSNCRWATAKEQQNNMRTNVRISYNGIIRTLAEWATELQIKPATLRARLKRRWSVERAFAQPVQMYVFQKEQQR